MKKILEKYPLFLVLLPLFIILYVQNRYDFLINYSFVRRELLILFITPFLFYAASLILFRSVIKANVYSFILLFFFFFTGEIKDFLSETFPSSFASSYKTVIPLSLTLLAITFFAAKKRTKFEKTILFINSLCAIILITETLRFFFLQRKEPEVAAVNLSFKPCTDCERPDIYYIIFDSYSASPILANEFNFDNSAIESFLLSKGFQIINNSKSNYNLTPFCMASTFDVEYITGADTAKKYLIRDYYSGIRKVYKSALFPIFEKQGYTIFNHSIFDIEQSPSSIPHFDMWESKLLYQQYNIFRKTYNEIGWNFPLLSSLSFKRKSRNEYIIERDIHDSTTLSHLHRTIRTQSEKPKFIYGHIFLPHSPYSFDSSGNKINITHSLSPDQDKKAYLEQLIYSNKLMKDLVEDILLNTKKQPVIIIQGDHGYRFFDSIKKQEEFPNFNAIYLPEKYKTGIPDSISGVNTFRYILNRLFKQDYPLLEYKSFFLRYN